MSGWPTSPLLVSVSGPYGVGKDSVLAELEDHVPRPCRRLTTWTTRPVRVGDQHYKFIEFGDIPELVSHGTWLRNDQFGGRVAYLTNLDEITEPRSNVIYLHSFHASMESLGRARLTLGNDLLAVGLLPPGDNEGAKLAVLRERLVRRATDSPEKMQERIRNNQEILTFMESKPATVGPGPSRQIFDTFLTNLSLGETVRNTSDIVKCRLKI